MVRGKVTYWNAEQKYGFVRAGNWDFYFAAIDCVGEVARGDEVEFIADSDPHRGRSPKAKCVHRVEKS
jgi:cold shock CspA family protein